MKCLVGISKIKQVTRKHGNWQLQFDKYLKNHLENKISIIFQQVAKPGIENDDVETVLFIVMVCVFECVLINFIIKSQFIK